MWFALQNGHALPTAGSVLHIAPEPCLRGHLARLGARYVTGDLERSDVDLRVDLTDLQFDDGTFDAVIASRVLEHIDDDRTAISEVHRVLKPGGMAFLSVPWFRGETIEFGEPRADEKGHWRRPGVDYLDRFKSLFSVDLVLTHDAQEIWQSGRLVSVTSTTDRDGTRLQVSGSAVADGFRIVGENGPFLAAAQLLSTNALWDSRIVHEQRLIDVQYGGEIGLVTRPFGEEQVATPQGQVRASRYQMITPHYAGSVFYDGHQRWIKALIEMKGQTIEYALAT
jgi:SAM-dependent methyltransferase